jgi:hypothetical protein
VLDALSNCAIRFANSDEDARFLAPRLRTSQDFLQSLGRGKFAAFVRDMTQDAVAVSVNRADFRQHPTLSPVEQTALAARMRQDYGVPLQLASPVDPPATEPAEQAPPIEERPRQERPPRSSSARPDPPRPAATGSDKPAGTEAAREW